MTESLGQESMSCAKPIAVSNLSDIGVYKSGFVTVFN